MTPRIIGFAGKAGSGKDTAGLLLTTYEYRKLAFADPIRQFAGRVFALSARRMDDRQLKVMKLYAEHAWPFKNRETFDLQIRHAVATLLDLTWAERSPAGERHHAQLDRFPFEPPSEIIAQVQERMWAAFGARLIPIAQAAITPREILQLVGTDVFRALWDDFWIQLWRSKAQAYDRVYVPDVRYPNEVDEIHRLGGVVFGVARPGLSGEDGGVTGHPSERGFADLAVDAIVVNGGTKSELWDAVERALALVTPPAADPAALGAPPCSGG